MIAKRRAREWGITPRLYSDFAQVLDDAAVDAVELLTPTWMHADQIVAALVAGKHVSAQKPLTISIAEAERIAAAVAKARTTGRCPRQTAGGRPAGIAVAHPEPAGGRTARMRRAHR